MPTADAIRRNPTQSDAIRIDAIPYVVPVSDDRGEVRGAHVTVHHGASTETISGTVIPPEGIDVTCWMDSDLWGSLDVLELLDATMEPIAEAAAEGAQGRGSSYTIEAI